MQDKMLWISGLPSEQGLPAPLVQWLESGSAAWLPAEQVLRAPRGAPHEQRGAELLWLYRAPWDGAAAGANAEAVAGWLQAQRGLLRLRPRLKSRLWLLNVDTLDLPALAEELGLPADAWHEDEAPGAELAEGIGLLLAKAYEWAAPECWDVFEALESAAWGPGRTPLLREQLASPGPQALEALQARLSQADSAPARQALADAQAALDLAQAAHQGAMQELRATQEAEANHLKAQLQDAQAEAELLLLQLHQVQEELEQIFLKSREQEATTASLSNDLAWRTQERDAALAERDAAQRALADAQATTASLSNDLAWRTQERDAALGERDAAQRALAEAQEESELLLLQLHQVQEELETHFLRGRELEQELAALRARSERFQKRHPDLIDLDEVQVLAADAAAAVPTVDWRVTGLAATGRIWPELTLRTVLQDGRAGLELMGPAEAGRSGGPVLPRLLAARDEAQLARFRAIGTRVWRLMLKGTAALDQALAAGRSGLAGAPEGFDPLFWRQALATLSEDMKALPPMFRFDAVRLKREKVNPDYEHLWLAFEGASFGERDLPGFELRLGAANTQPGGFSVMPKLELPPTAEGKPPFQGWFEESRDDYGPKLELRAELERKAFDLAVWGRIPAPGQQLLLSVIAVLPQALTSLQTQGQSLSRPWKAWTSLLDGLIQVMRLRLVTPAAAPRARPAAAGAPAAAPALAAPAKAPAAEAPASAALPTPTPSPAAAAPPAKARPAGKKVAAPSPSASSGKAPPKPAAAPAGKATAKPAAKTAGKPVTKAAAKPAPKPAAKAVAKGKR